MITPTLTSLLVSVEVLEDTSSVKGLYGVGSSIPIERSKTSSSSDLVCIHTNSLTLSYFFLFVVVVIIIVIFVVIVDISGLWWLVGGRLSMVTDFVVIAGV